MPDVCDSAGRNDSTVIVCVVYIWCQRDSDGHSVSLSRIDLSIIRVYIVRLICISHVVLAKRRTALTTAAGWNHPAEQLIGQSSILVVEAHGMTAIKVATCRSSTRVN